MTSLLGSGRRCHLARAAAALASSLDFLQGTSEKSTSRVFSAKSCFKRWISCGERMRACWAATLFVLVQPSPAFCATCRGTSVVPRVLALTRRHFHKSPCAPYFCVSVQGFTPPSIGLCFGPCDRFFHQGVECHFRRTLSRRCALPSRPHDGRRKVGCLGSAAPRITVLAARVAQDAGPIGSLAFEG